MMIGVKRYRGRGIPERRDSALVHDVRFENIDYSREDQVKRAREAITGMGMLDRVIDRTFRDGEKKRMLDVMADMVLCHHAAIWKEKYPHAELAESLSKLNRDEVQIQFMNLLSPEGRRIMLGRHVNTPGGTRFSPNTGTTLDTLFSVTLTHEEAKKLLQNMANYSPYVSDHAWERHRENVSSGEAMMALARAHRGSGAYDSAASAHGTAALCFAEAGHMQAAAEAYANAVQDRDSAGEAGLAATEVGELAKMWEANDRHDLAANAWADQAERYQALNWLEPAAKARGRQARCAADADLHDMAQAGWLAQADIYRSLDRHDQAQESQKQAGKQGELHRTSTLTLSVLPPEMVREIANHLDPEDVMSLAAASKTYRSAITWPGVPNVTVRVLEAMPPSEYIAELRNDLPSINRLHPNSRLESMQMLVAKLHTLSDRKREPAFHTLLSAAASLPRPDQLEVTEALLRNIELLEPLTRLGAWNECFATIRSDASRLPAWVALWDSVGFLPKEDLSYYRMAAAIEELEPSDPGKGPVVLAIASYLEQMDDGDYRDLIIGRLYGAVKGDGFYRARLQEETRTAPPD